MNAREIRNRARGVRAITNRLTENPVAAVLTALAAGFLAGMLLRLFESREREK